MTKIFFDHIPKTAGSSIRQLFVDIYGENNVSTIIKNMKPLSAINLFKNKKVIIGHFDFLPNDKIPDDFFTATCLRDPRERLLSHFYYIKNNVLESMLNKNEKSLKNKVLEEALFDDFFVAQVYNYQSIHFAKLYSPAPEKLDSDMLFSLACQGIDQYDLVGTYENLQGFIRALKEKLFISSNIQIKNTNITLDRKSFEDLSTDVKKRINELVEIDFNLWKYSIDFLDRKKLINTKNSKIENEYNSLLKSKNLESTALNIIDIKIIGQLNNTNNYISGELLKLSIILNINQQIDNFTLGYSIHHESGLNLFGTNTSLLGNEIKTYSENIISFTFSFVANLGIGSYYVNLSAHTGLSHLDSCFLLKEKALKFDITGFLDEPYEGLVNLTPSFEAKILKSNQYSCKINKSISQCQKIGLIPFPIKTARGYISFISNPLILNVSTQYTIPFFISNESEQVWLSSGTLPVLISYHWRKSDSSIYIHDGLRTPLPSGKLFANTNVQGSLFLETPTIEGEYLLEITLVQEGEAWLEERGFKSATTLVQVNQ